ncbi:MAG TPA: oligosaccharide flippase family protein [Rhodanobacteraceae bacterium]|nr:oligosaccharide flippase family protein [Rhodanobacteraceae bacterium]
MNLARIPGFSLLRLPEVSGAGGAFSLSVFARGIGLVNAALLARLLQPDGFGLYSYAYSIVALLAIPAMFGIPVVVTREVAAGERLGRWDLVRGVIRWAHAGVALFSAVILLLAGCWLAFFGARHLGAADTAVYALALAMVPLLALDALRGAILTGLRRVVLGQLPATFLRPGLMLVALLVAWLAWPRLFADPLRAMALLVAAAALAYAIGGWILLRVQPPAIHAARPAYRARAWSISAVPVGLTDGMYLLNQYAGIVILGLFAAKAEVGEYRIAILAADVVVLAARAVGAAFSPYFARHTATPSGHAALQHAFTLSARLGLAAAAPVAVIYLVFGRALINLVFGTAYAEAWLPLMILVAGYVVNAAVGSATVALYMSGHERNVLTAVAVGVMVNVAGCAALIPPFGLMGAAIAAAVGGVVAVAGCGWFVWRRLGVAVGPLDLIRTADFT